MEKLINLTDLNDGQIIEKVIRGYGYSISDISRKMHVNRRSVYNWFNIPKLRPETIYKIGVAINHDFSQEFPDIFSEEEFNLRTIRKFSSIDHRSKIGTIKEEFDKEKWQRKYVNLLDNYNNLLSNYYLVDKPA